MEKKKQREESAGTAKDAEIVEQRQQAILTAETAAKAALMPIENVSKEGEESDWDSGSDSDGTSSTTDKEINFTIWSINPLMLQLKLGALVCPNVGT